MQDKLLMKRKSCNSEHHFKDMLSHQGLPPSLVNQQAVHTRNGSALLPLLGKVQLVHPKSPEVLS